MILQINALRSKRPDIHTSIELASFNFFDIETTGLRPDRGAKITEVAILNRNSTQFIWNTENIYESSCLALHLPIILQKLQSGVVVGHNLRFDFWFLAYESERIGLRVPKIWFIDTLSIARKVLGSLGSYQLRSLLKVFNIHVCEDLHEATIDAEATRALFWKLVSVGTISTLGEAGVKRLSWSNF